MLTTISGIHALSDTGIRQNGYSVTLKYMYRVSESRPGTATMHVRRHILARLLFVVMAFIATAQPCHAFSLALDSIASWGRFPNFCIKTYRWGDRFFNSYDSTYVVGTGTKFNVKFKTDSWIDHYLFELENDTRINMVSDASTAMGAYLTYLAVSVGYDINISRYFNGNTKSRKRFNFAFNCALFGADMYIYDNNIGTTITRFGHRGDPDKVHIPFKGLDNKAFGLDLYYFLNNKRYSQAAAFNFSKIQRRSQGSWYFGFTYLNERYQFNFSGLDDVYKNQLPGSWNDYTYHVRVKNYFAKVGYGYNWVLGRHWLVGVSESPMFGVRNGVVNATEKKNTFGAYNLFRVSGVYNRRNLFTGLVCRISTSLIRDKESMMISNMMSFELSVGYRFNLW